MWILAIAHCQSHLTDGFVSTLVLPLLGIPTGYRRLAQRLVNVGLFEEVEGGYMVHDYLEYNPKRDVVLQRRAEDLERKRRGFRTDSARNPYAPDSSRPTPTPTPERSKPKSKPSARTPSESSANGAENKAVFTFLAKFCEHYHRALDGAKYAVVKTRDVPLVRRLLALHGPERLEQLAVVMLHADDKFIAESDRGIQILSTKINWLESRLRAAEART